MSASLSKEKSTGNGESEKEIHAGDITIRMQHLLRKEFGIVLEESDTLRLSVSSGNRQKEAVESHETQEVMISPRYDEIVKLLQAILSKLPAVNIPTSYELGYRVSPDKFVKPQDLINGIIHLPLDFTDGLLLQAEAQCFILFWEIYDGLKDEIDDQGVLQSLEQIKEYFEKIWVHERQCSILMPQDLSGYKDDFIYKRYGTYGRKVERVRRPLVLGADRSLMIPAFVDCKKS